MNITNDMPVFFNPFTHALSSNEVNCLLFRQDKIYICINGTKKITSVCTDKRV